MSDSDPSSPTTPPSSGDNGDHNSSDKDNNNNNDDNNKKDSATSPSSATTNQSSPTLHNDDTVATEAATSTVSTLPSTDEAVTSNTNSATVSLFDDGENTLEEAFALIQKGNQLQKKSHNDDGSDNNNHNNDGSNDADNCWEASFAYCKAQAILNNLALAAATAVNQDATTNNTTNSTDDDDSETNKIRALYQRQSREYFFKARQALVSAMMQESAHDTTATTTPPTTTTTTTTTTAAASDSIDMIYETLSDVNARDRLTLFARLYARESILLQQAQQQQQKNDTNDTDTNNVQEQQSSLEERLMKLNQSLPSGFKTSEERMRDINRGLNRLGLSSVVTTTSNNNITSGGPFSMLGSTPVKSEFDQVEDIIAQARDEVALQQQQYGIPDSNNNNIGSGIGTSTGGAVPNNTSLAQDVAATLLSGVDINDNDDSLSSASSHDVDVDESENVDLTINDIRVIQEYVNEAQAQLAQLNVMLQLDGANEQHAEIEFDPASGRHKLLLARKCLALANRKFAILE